VLPREGRAFGRRRGEDSRAATTPLGGVRHVEHAAVAPDNPHYFLYQGKPTLLITSGEHYGAVLNRAFRLPEVPGELQHDGLNLTRTFVGGSWSTLRPSTSRRTRSPPGRGS